MSFTSFDDTVWALGADTNCNLSPLDELTSYPGSSLGPQASQQYMSVDGDWLSQYQDGNVDLICTWNLTTAPGAWFGIWIHIPFQMLSIGTGPYWYYGSNKSGQGGGFVKAEPRAAPQSVETGVASIKAVPTIGHSSLVVAVSVSPLTA